MYTKEQIDFIVHICTRRKEIRQIEDKLKQTTIDPDDVEATILKLKEDTEYLKQIAITPEEELRFTEIMSEFELARDEMLKKLSKIFTLKCYICEKHSLPPMIVSGHLCDFGLCPHCAKRIHKYFKCPVCQKEHTYYPECRPFIHTFPTIADTWRIRSIDKYVDDWYDRMGYSGIRHVEPFKRIFKCVKCDCAFEKMIELYEHIEQEHSQPWDEVDYFMKREKVVKKPWIKHHRHHQHC